MRTLLFPSLLFVTAEGVSAQEKDLPPQTDTLQRITWRKSMWSVSGYRFEYGTERYSSPRQLRPYVLASGDTLAIYLFEKSRKKKRAAVLVHTAGSLLAAGGAVLIFSGAIDLILANDSSDGRTVPGAVLVGTGIGGGVAGMVLRERSNTVLLSAIDRYNQSRRPRVSWTLGTAGTDLRLIGRF